MSVGCVFKDLYTSLPYYASKFSPDTKKEFINLRVFDLDCATLRIN